MAEALGGISPHTLRNWWKQARIDRDKAPGVGTDESEEMRRLRRENLELRRAKEILRKALAFFTAELEELKRIHAENYSIYGVRKRHHAMACTGWQIGRDHVARLMRAAGLQAVRRGHRPITTRPAREPDTRPDVVGRRFAAERPHQLWVADITDVRILAGFCYVVFVTDVFTRRIAGWAVSASLHTQGLPLLALEHALLSTAASRGRQGQIHPPGPKRPVRRLGLLRRAHHRRGECLGGHRGRLVIQRPLGERERAL
ncbi:IS3 family transposase [Micrococcus lylae]|uniref:IS3 family transposase n=1 Tax=Micrococcus lylae TaxID=1273 RepID=UPI0035CD2DED